MCISIKALPADQKSFTSVDLAVQGTFTHLFYFPIQLAPHTEGFIYWFGGGGGDMLALLATWKGWGREKQQTLRVVTTILLIFFRDWMAQGCMLPLTNGVAPVREDYNHDYSPKTGFRRKLKQDDQHFRKSY